MKRQETFDKVVSAIIAQGCSSVDGGICRYRGPGGIKCAAGHLIPDDKYDPKFESCSLIYTVDKQDIMEELGQLIVSEGHNLGLVKLLQRAHDDISDEPDFLERFKTIAREIADQYGLEWQHA